MDLTIRPVETADREAWVALWRDYLAFYDTTLPPEIYDAQFDRITARAPAIHGRLALVDGRPLGLAHFLYHPHGWKSAPVCYLQDLFVAPEARGTGLGRALIEAVYAEADAAGAPDVYWMTQRENDVARRLYDRIGILTPFIKYARR